MIYADQLREGGEGKEEGHGYMENFETFHTKE